MERIAGVSGVLVETALEETGIFLSDFKTHRTWPGVSCVLGRRD
jgi:hypothetical protein